MSGSSPSQPEQATYDATVYQLQATDNCQAASGTSQGVLNAPLLNLANRTGWLKGAVGAIMTSLTGYAPLNSPGFTGTPQAPTPPVGDNSTALATTAFVQKEVAVAGSNILVAYTSSTWTCPVGVAWVRVRIWGGGGPGGAGNGGAGGGGAGGAYSERRYGVTPGQVYGYTIGSGGIGTTGGQSSNFDGAIFAGGGGPGVEGPNGVGSTNFGVATGAPIEFEGQSGTNGLATSTVNFSGAGGASYGFAGGIGVILPTTQNQNGGVGQVGCGGSGGVGTGVGGPGVGGLLILEY